MRLYLTDFACIIPSKSSHLTFLLNSPFDSAQKDRSHRSQLSAFVRHYMQFTDSKVEIIMVRRDVFARLDARNFYSHKAFDFRKMTYSKSPPRNR